MNRYIKPASKKFDGYYIYGNMYGVNPKDHNFHNVMIILSCIETNRDDIEEIVNDFKDEFNALVPYFTSRDNSAILAKAIEVMNVDIINHIISKTIFISCYSKLLNSLYNKKLYDSCYLFYKTQSYWRLWSDCPVYNVMKQLLLEELIKCNEWIKNEWLYDEKLITIELSSYL